MGIFDIRAPVSNMVRGEIPQLLHMFQAISTEVVDENTNKIIDTVHL
jgi:hypothetical protein